jgi:hypothetical protein
MVTPIDLMWTRARQSPEPDDRTNPGFPLASIALLVTALACLLVCADVARFRAQYAILSASGVWQPITLFGVAGIFGGIVGLVYMFRRSWDRRTWATAPTMGILAGEAGALVLLAPGALWRTILAISILLMTVILIRLDTD